MEVGEGRFWEMLADIAEVLFEGVGREEGVGMLVRRIMWPGLLVRRREV